MKEERIEWRNVELKELADKIHPYPVGDGDHGKIKPSMYLPEGIPYIRVGDMVDDKISFKEIVYISEKVHQGNIGKELVPGDIIIAKTGATIGKVAIIPPEIKRANTTASIGKITLDRKITIPEYLLYFMKTSNFKTQMWAVSSKSAQPGFNIIDLKKFRVLVPFSNGKPDLKEQERIVSILENAEKIKGKCKKGKELLDEYLKSIFYEMFLNKGFEEVRLGDLCEINPKKSELGELNDKMEVSFVPMEDINEHQIYFEVKKTKKMGEVYSGYTYFREGDVLLAKVTPCFENGKSGIAKKLKNKVGFGSSEYHVLRTSNKIIRELVYYIISSKRFIEAGKEHLTGTGGLRRLPKSYLENFRMPLPPLPLQQKFASVVEQIEKMKENIDKTQKNSEELFNSLMQKAFRGGL